MKTVGVHTGYQGTSVAPSNLHVCKCNMTGNRLRDMQVVTCLEFMSFFFKKHMMMICTVT